MSKGDVLRKKHIAIVSGNKVISEFLSLEAQSCGCSSNIMTRLPVSFVDYDVIIVDDDGSFRIPENTDGIYKIIHSGEQNGENTFLWPVPVAEIRSIYEGYVAEAHARIFDAEDDVLYLSGFEEKAVVYRNRRIALTDGEWRVMSCLGSADGNAVSREKLMSLFDAVDGNIADVYICHLRRKLETPFGVRFIKTVRGKGYSLNVRISEIK